MLKVTFDNNAILDLELENERTPHILELIEFHKQGYIRLQISKVGASEKRKASEGGGYRETFDEFESKLKLLPLPKDVEQLYPPAIWGMMYWGQSLYCGEEEKQQLTELWEILFPNANPELSNYRNKACDVLTLYSHIKQGGNIFVTSDKRFLSCERKEKLITKGAGKILSPQEAVYYIRQTV